ncbi:MAG TPA: hypothetical protein VEF03_06060, partial [Candidatus Binataceae bacterium]|nr:hypothetical protein [Candidatus Binataceae bacterium]
MPLGPDDQLRTVVLPVALAGTDILNDPRCYERIRGTTWDYIYYFTFFLSYPPAPLDSAKCLEIAYRKFYGYPDAAPSVTPTPSVTAS